MSDSSGHGKSGSKNSEELRAYLDSDVLGRGCSKTRRTACQHTELIAFSCKAQGILYICPSCTAKRAELFSDHFNTHVFAQKYPTTTWCLLSRNGSPPERSSSMTAHPNPTSLSLCKCMDEHPGVNSGRRPRCDMCAPYRMSEPIPPTRISMRS